MISSSSSDSENEEIVVRRERIFRNRINYQHITGNYEFNERFRLRYEKFQWLLGRIENHLNHPTRRNKALSAKQQLEIALHWFGTGAQYHAVGDMHGVSKATVCRVIRTVVDGINEILFNEVVAWPNDVNDVAFRFSQIAGMPLIFGAVDGTLINIDAPSEHEAAFVDRFGDHSLNIMLVCGADMIFYYCNANWPGSVSDARVLRTSTLHDRLEQGWRPLEGGVLLGDSIYPLKSWLIPPVIRNENDRAQIRFLRAHRSTRRVIENAIGILKEKFTCLRHLRVNPIYACNIIKCCVTLCNLAKEARDDQYIVNGAEDNDQNQLNNIYPIDRDANAKLQFFYNHFQ